MKALTIRNVHIEAEPDGIRICGEGAIAVGGRVIESGEFCTPVVKWDDARDAISKGWRDVEAEARRTPGNWRKFWHWLTGKD